MTDTKVVPFSYQDHPVRTIQLEGSSYFVGKDVCKVLGLKSHRQTIKRLDDDEKKESQIVTPSGLQKMIVINESGLYHLIFRSRKPEAKRFRRWVTSEVLPALRKTGSYQTTTALPATKQLHLPFLDNDFYLDNVKREMMKVALTVGRNSRTAKFLRLVEPLVFAPVKSVE